MISVTIEVETDRQSYQIGQLRITNLSGRTHGDEDEAQYIAEFALVEGDDLSLMSRPFSFRRKEYNVFALIRQAIETLTYEELQLNGKAESGDAFHMRRGLALWVDRMRDNNE